MFLVVDSCWWSWFILAGRFPIGLGLLFLHWGYLLFLLDWVEYKWVSNSWFYYLKSSIGLPTLPNYYFLFMLTFTIYLTFYFVSFYDCMDLVFVMSFIDSVGDFACLYKAMLLYYFVRSPINSCFPLFSSGFISIFDSFNPFFRQLFEFCFEFLVELTDMTPAFNLPDGILDNALLLGSFSP